MSSVVAVIELELLLSVGWIVRGVQIQNNLRRRGVPVAGDKQLNQALRHLQQISCGEGILQSGQRWLRGQVQASDRLAIRSYFKYRIRAQSIKVVTVFVTGNDAINSLPDHILKALTDLALLAIVSD